MSWYCATWAINRKHGRGRECKWCCNNPDHRKGVSLRPIAYISEDTADIPVIYSSAQQTKIAKSVKIDLDNP